MEGGKSLQIQPRGASDLTFLFKEIFELLLSQFIGNVAYEDGVGVCPGAYAFVGVKPDSRTASLESTSVKSLLV